MRPVEGGFVIPVMGTTLLKPGGFHIMLINLVEELEAGTMLDVTLTFSESGELEFMIPVREPGESGMSMGMDN